MKYKRLGKSGVDVSALCLGTMNFGSQTPEDEAIRIIHRAIDLGINFLDVANIYSKGVSEEIVGKALQQNGRRDETVIATKVGNGVGSGPNMRGTGRLHIMKECEKSLRRLMTDHIDVYYLHTMDLDTPLEETLGALDDLVRQGKIRYPACSKFAPGVLTEAMMLCRQHGWAPFVCEQPPYNIVDRRIENEHIYTCLRWGLGICPWAPYAHGLLSGKYRPGAEPPPGSRWQGEASGLMGMRFTPAALEAAERLKPVAEAKGVPLAEFALAWVAQQPGITAPIIGPRTMAHLESALGALGIVITAEDRQAVDKIVAPGDAVANFFDRNFGRHMRAAIGV